jgi:predicted ATP-dependent serine protease
VTRMKKGFMTLFASLLLAVSAAAPVSAANQQQDGLVNVAVGDVSILNDANVGVAAAVAASVCGVKVGPVAVLATQVDRSGDTRTVCDTATGPLTLTQNQ